MRLYSEAFGILRKNYPIAHMYDFIPSLTLKWYSAAGFYQYFNSYAYRRIKPTSYACTKTALMETASKSNNTLYFMVLANKIDGV